MTMAAHGGHDTYDHGRISSSSVTFPSQDLVELPFSPHPTITTTSSSHLSIKWGKPRPRLIAFLLFSGFLLVAVGVGVSRIKAKPTVHITFHASSENREVRVFSQYPDLSQLSDLHTSLSLVSRLQLLDTKRCRDDPRTCELNVVCDSSLGQDINCRCRTGYYFSDLECLPCSSKCPAGHYVASRCSNVANVVCRSCTICSETQYVAAPCNTHKDTICIDVSFPAGLLPMNLTHLPDDKINIDASHSSNVFLERLVDETQPLGFSSYVTNNQQLMDGVIDRLSSLKVSVTLSDIFLVPIYHEVDRKVEDVETYLMNDKHSPMPSNIVNLYSNIQNDYCRHPVPDYYKLQLEVFKDRIAKAKVTWCDSKNEGDCPSHKVNGARHVKWDFNTACPYEKKYKLNAIHDGPNSVVCTEETPMLTKIFKRQRPTTQELAYPVCWTEKKACKRCLDTANCNNSAAGTYGVKSQCCGISCFSTDACLKAYSPQCPKAEVVCAKGNLNVFSLFPVFDSLEYQFRCHLNYKPPSYLYKLTYRVRIPSLNYNSSAISHTVALKSRKEHERKINKYDFLYALHDTMMPLEEELLMYGEYRKLHRFRHSQIRPYTIRPFKTAEEMNKYNTYQLDDSQLNSYIQFERPFEYSSYNWYSNRCYPNMSTIFPNQTMHSRKELSIEAKIEDYGSQGLGFNQERKFSYQMYPERKQPYIKLFIREKASVLQHLQGREVKGTLIASSLYGEVTWHYKTALWKITLTGVQLSCPSIVSIKIFTQMMTGCAGYFDAFLACPEDFTISFEFYTVESDLPDIFILQINDSTTSHNVVLSSMYAPINLEPPKSTYNEIINEGNSWLPLVFAMGLTFILLVVIIIAYHCINQRTKRTNVKIPPHTPETEIESEKVALNNEKHQMNNDNARPNNSPSSVIVHKPKVKWFVRVFVVLYIIYCLIFSFIFTSSIIYLTYKNSIKGFSLPKYSGKELLQHINQSFTEIKNFENKEHLRLFELYEGRRHACLAHLKNENKKLLQDYHETTQKQISDVFMEDGVVHKLTNKIQRQNVSMYVYQISEFLMDCNKTVHSIVDRFESNYFQFLKKSVVNDWMKFPRQIFLVQDGEVDPDRILSSTQIKQFASWLEIDKVGELLALRDNLVHRLKQIPEPSVTSINITFPSLDSEIFHQVPNIQLESQHHIYTMTVLESSNKYNDTFTTNDNYNSDSNTKSSKPKSKTKRFRRNAVDNDREGLMPPSANPVTLFGISGNVQPSTDFKLSKNDNERQNVDKVNKNDDDKKNEDDDEDLGDDIIKRDDFNEIDENSSTVDYDDDNGETYEVDDYGKKNMMTYGNSNDTDDENEDELNRTGEKLPNGTESGSYTFFMNDDENNNDDDDIIKGEGHERIDKRTKTNDDVVKVPLTHNVGSAGQKSNYLNDHLSSLENGLKENSENNLKIPLPKLLSTPKPANDHKNDNSKNTHIDNEYSAFSSSSLTSRLTQGKNEIYDHDNNNRYNSDKQDNENNDNEDTNDDIQEDEDNSYLYILIGVFVAMDIVLLMYRLSWLSNQMYAVKNGYADRIPTDEACKQVLEIQTAYHLPAFNGSMENTGTYVDGKDHQLFGSDSDRGGDTMTFLQPMPNTKNDDILQQIWNEKSIQSEAGRWNAKCCIVRWWERMKQILQPVFLSQLVWQACVTFLAITSIYILVYMLENWLRPDNFRTLVSSHSAALDVQWQLATSSHYLTGVAKQLSRELGRLRQLCDMEVAILTEAFFSTVNTQTSAFTMSLQRLCEEAKGKNCDRLSVFKPAGGRIVSCNFLPLQAETMPDFTSNTDELVSMEVNEFLQVPMTIISTSSFILVIMLCLRLLCQAVASTLRHYLLLTGKLPRVKVYQSEEPAQLVAGAMGDGGPPDGFSSSSSGMQRSQSWVDSCESGVYVGEVDDNNKEEASSKLVVS